MTLVEAVYRLTSTCPDSERFGLTAQGRRSAVSVPSDIAEGAARRSTLEFLRFLSVARGSLAELGTPLQIAVRLGFAPPSADMDELIHKTFAKLNAFIRSLDKQHTATARGA